MNKNGSGGTPKMTAIELNNLYELARDFDLYDMVFSPYKTYDEEHKRLMAKYDEIYG